MTDLCRESARAFYRDGNPAFVSAAATTTDTGIRDLVPGELIHTHLLCSQPLLPA